MAQIPAAGLSHYAVVYGLNSTKLKDKVVGYQSAYWNTMDDCFSNICAFGAGYKRAKGYSRMDLDVPKVLVFSEVISTKEAGLCFKFCGLHFQKECTKNKGHSNSKFQNYKETDSSQKFHQNIGNSVQFPTGTLSFQALQ